MRKEQQVKVVNGGTGPGFLLFLVFLVLKLTGVIGWSWWWVTAPLWIPLGIGLSILAIATIFASIAVLVAGIANLFGK